MTAKPRRGLLAAVAVAALGVMGAIAPAAAQEWRGWNIHAADYPNGIGMDAFTRMVAERTNNRIRMRTFHSAQLGQQDEAIQQMRLGTIDFAIGNSKVFRTTGTFKQWQGTMLVDDDDLARSRVEVVVRTDSVQMLDDEQTQSLPRDDARRAAVAAMMGQSDLAAFDAEVVAVLKSVHAAFSAQFSDGESLATGLGSLVLTGVEPTPDTLQTLASLGFSDPARVWETLTGWAAGRARARWPARAWARAGRWLLRR